MKSLNLVYYALLVIYGILLVADIFEIGVALGIAIILYGVYKILVSLIK